MINDKIRVGFIGAGQNSRKMHIPKLQALPGVELIEVANRTLASTEKVASEFNIQRVRSSWQEIVASGDVDAIVIGTWPYLHCKASCAALNSGKHVPCEAQEALQWR
jgi:predicted dehydrogenase